MSDLTSVSFKISYDLRYKLMEEARVYQKNNTEIFIKILEKHFNEDKSDNSIALSKAVEDPDQNKYIELFEDLASERDMWKEECELAENKLEQLEIALEALKKKDSTLRIEETSLTKAHNELQFKFSELQETTVKLKDRIRKYETPAVIRVYNYAINGSIMAPYVKDVPDALNILAEDFIKNHLTNNTNETQFQSI